MENPSPAWSLPTDALLNGLSATPAGEHETVVLLGLGPQGAGSHLLARITRRSWDDLGLAERMMVYAQVKSVALAPA